MKEYFRSLVTVVQASSTNLSKAFWTAEASRTAGFSWKAGAIRTAVAIWAVGSFWATETSWAEQAWLAEPNPYSLFNQYIAQPSNNDANHEPLLGVLRSR